jgi:hypothetical protein
MSLSEFHIESNGGVINVISGATETVSVPTGLLSEDTLYSWKVRYYSDVSGIASEWSPITTFSTVWTPRDTPIVYDGADYPVTNQIESLNGGYGWVNAWDVKDLPETNLPMSIGVVSPGLSFNTLPVAGNTFIMNDFSTNASSIYALRKMKVGDGVYHMTADNGKFGKPGSTNWFSFLATIGADCTNKSFLVGPSITTWDILSVRGSYLPESDAVTWKLSGYAVAGASMDIVKTNETALLVARFISGSVIETNGTAHLWINPTLSETPPDPSTAVSMSTNGFRPFTFDNFLVKADVDLINSITNISGGVTNVVNTYEAPPKVKYDEIRFGDSWLSVTGVPEPCLFIVYYLSLIIFCRRK